MDKDDLAGFHFDTLIKSLKAKYYLACMVVDTLTEQLKDVNKSYSFLQKEADVVAIQNKKYSKELCDVYEIIDEILHGIEKTCMPVALVKQKLNDIKQVNNKRGKG